MYNDDRTTRAVFEDLFGETIVKIDQGKCKGADGNDALTFYTKHGSVYEMYHVQDCCENVYIEDICGDLEDIMDSEILLAEGVAGEVNDDQDKDIYDEWTFYKLSTIKG